RVAGAGAERVPCPRAHHPLPRAPQALGDRVLSARPAALVTGSAKGVGRAILLGLARDGFDVAVHFRSSSEEAEKIAAEAEELGVDAITLRADVTVEEEARGLVDAFHERFGRLDVLV